MRVAPGTRGPIALIMVASLSGCATQKPAPPPLLDLSALHCGPAPVLAGAPPLAYDPGKHQNETSAELTAASSCFKDSVGSSLYVTYALPASPTPYLVRVDSEPEGATLLALRVLLYGSDGSLQREFSRHQIVFRGSALSVIFRAHPGERYLVVASDPRAVGQRLTQLRDATQGTAVAAYPVFFTVYSGTDATVKNTLSQNGRVAISLQPLPGK
jgi:hypothetical protein